MKAIYLLVIVSLVACLTTKEKIQCFTENENLLEQVAKVIDAFRTKDFQIILKTILSSYFSVKDNIKECLNGEPNLKMTYCGFICHGYSNKNCLETCEKRRSQGIKDDKNMPSRPTSRIRIRPTSRIRTTIIRKKQNQIPELNKIN